jgi:uncharacterized membrane protein
MLKKTFQKIKQIATPAPRTVAEFERDEKQLARMGVLVDVLFAILIWQIFQYLPVPSPEKFDRLSDIGLFNLYGDALSKILIGLILVIIYWIQNNRMFGNLMRTDGRHATLSLFQVFFLFLYLYSLGLEMAFPGNQATLVAQSIFLALTGYTGVAAWAYASHNRRLIGTITDAEATHLGMTLWAEPLAATFTISFAFVSPLAWDLSWLSLFVFGWLLRINRRRKSATTSRGTN